MLPPALGRGRGLLGGHEAGRPPGSGWPLTHRRGPTGVGALGHGAGVRRLAWGLAAEDLRVTGRIRKPERRLKTQPDSPGAPPVVLMAACRAAGEALCGAMVGAPVSRALLGTPVPLGVRAQPCAPGGSLADSRGAGAGGMCTCLLFSPRFPRLGRGFGSRAGSVKGSCPWGVLVSRGPGWQSFWAARGGGRLCTSSSGVSP